MTVHLRVPSHVRDAIAKRAEEERRPWTQMAVLLLTDAALARAPSKPGKEKKR